MRLFIKRLVVFLGALAFLAGGTIAFAAPMMPGEPCPYEHVHGESHQHPHRQQHTNVSDCLGCCCIGASVAAPALPTLDVNFVPSTVHPVVYWELSTAASGRLVAPDLGPPKPCA